jgi:ABC-type transport system involved in Fe-S cluster assembly fused permease/ATPase subunit
VGEEEEAREIEVLPSGVPVAGLFLLRVGVVGGVDSGDESQRVPIASVLLNIPLAVKKYYKMNFVFW